MLISVIGSIGTSLSNFVNFPLRYRSLLPRHAPLKRPLGVHRLEELLVGLRPLHLVYQKFHRLDGVELRQQLAQDPDPVERTARQQQLLFARRRTLNIDRRENALFEQPPVERDLLIASPLELFEDDFLHPAPGLSHRPSTT